jgi:hypothetical protein
LKRGIYKKKTGFTGDSTVSEFIRNSNQDITDHAHDDLRLLETIAVDGDPIFSSYDQMRHILEILGKRYPPLLM